MNEGVYDATETRSVDIVLTTMVIKEEEVTGKIDKLKAEKAQGPDGINPKLLKECKNVLCDPLTAFQQINEGGETAVSLEESEYIADS